MAPTDIFILPPPGTVAWNDENLEGTDNYKTIIDKLQKVVNQRRLDCWPPFKDYDKSATFWTINDFLNKLFSNKTWIRLSHGHVTKKQFNQSLTKIGIQLSDKDLAILEAKFVNKKGFNYLEFLMKLQPSAVEKAKYADLKDELDRLNTVKPVYESKPLNDIQSILLKVKDLVRIEKKLNIFLK